MAISGSDGSIVLQTKVDTKGINGGLNTIRSSISKIGGVMAVAFSARAISNFAKETKELYKIQMQNEVKLATVMRQRMKATDDEIKSMLELASAQQQIGIIGDEVQLAGLQQVATFATQKKTIETLLPAMNNLIAQQYGYEASTESARNVANLMGKVLQGQVGALTRVGITFTETEEQMLKTGNEMERASVLAKVITNNVGEMNTALAQTDVGRQQQLANTWGDIKEQFGSAFQQISILFLPVLQKLAELLQWIAKSARSVAQTIANAFGKKITNKNNGIQSLANSGNESADAMKKLGKETEKAGKKAKKSLSSFDEIQKLETNTSENKTDVDSSIASGGTETGTETGTGFNFGIQEQVDEISNTMATIMGVIGISLVAVGLILLFSGNIAWGIGFIISGAFLFSVSMAKLSQTDGGKDVIGTLASIMGAVGGALVAIGIILIMLGSIPMGVSLIVAGAISLISSIGTLVKFKASSVENILKTVTAIAGGALLALGIMLCIFSGPTPISIGLIVAGAISLVSSVALNSNKIIKALKGPIGLIVGIVSGALLVIGIILVCTGVALPLGIGLIVAGAIGLVSTVALNWNKIKKEVSKFIKENAGLIVGVSLALLVLGIILLFTGVGIPIAIGLIVVGVAGLVTTVALNWNKIKEKITTIFNSIINWVKTYGLLVLGIILCLTGVSIPLGIALIVKWAKDGAEKGVPLATVIVDKVKEIWAKVKQFWNTYIAVIFTKQWWLNLAKKCANGLITGFEKGVNGIITLFEKMINFIVNGLNKISFDVPDWVPVIGGKKFGFNIQNASLPRVSIPRLARGAVIPPNKEFLAVLGDQKQGTNIEAPADLIKQMVNEALIENGANQQINIVAKGDLDSIISLFKFEIERQERLAGATI